jgi:nucleoside-diphosphate kinase
VSKPSSSPLLFPLNPRPLNPPLGATKPEASAPGTIRGDLAIEVGRNVIHGSDTVENAGKEIALWFPEGVTEWTPVAKPWIYE